MPATLQKPVPDQQLDTRRQQFVKCTYCKQRFVLTWDDQEWNSVPEWIRTAAAAIRKTHPRHTDDQLPIQYNKVKPYR